eukprot:TRINITY_DN395518_c0_g1_i1.p1 TRINITY_DN395518_c0_g1~~TRINITY_DN395518_c0_g1_i1.p1  ORF type:complete len:1231 (-),score=339.92 TRINITY_DN395518_c0_g1_i1:131-3823(-)
MGAGESKPEEKPLSAEEIREKRAKVLSERFTKATADSKDTNKPKTVGKGQKDELVLENKEPALKSRKVGIMSGTKSKAETRPVVTVEKATVPPKPTVSKASPKPKVSKASLKPAVLKGVSPKKNEFVKPTVSKASPKPAVLKGVSPKKNEFVKPTVSEAESGHVKAKAPQVAAITESDNEVTVSPKKNEQKLKVSEVSANESTKPKLLEAKNIHVKPKVLEVSPQKIETEKQVKVSPEKNESVKPKMSETKNEQVKPKIPTVSPKKKTESTKQTKLSPKKPIKNNDEIRQIMMTMLINDVFGFLPAMNEKRTFDDVIEELEIYVFSEGEADISVVKMLINSVKRLENIMELEMGSVVAPEHYSKLKPTIMNAVQPRERAIVLDLWHRLLDGVNLSHIMESAGNLVSSVIFLQMTETVDVGKGELAFYEVLKELTPDASKIMGAFVRGTCDAFYESSEDTFNLCAKKHFFATIRSIPTNYMEDFETSLRHVNTLLSVKPIAKWAVRQLAVVKEIVPRTWLGRMFFMVNVQGQMAEFMAGDKNQSFALFQSKGDGWSKRIQLLHTMITDIMKKLFKTDQDVTLAFLQNLVVSLRTPNRSHMPHPAYIVLSGVILELAAPFIENDSLKYEKIIIKEFANKTACWKDPESLRGLKSNEIESNETSSESNFITKMFILAMNIVHDGIIHHYGQMELLLRSASHQDHASGTSENQDRMTILSIAGDYLFFPEIVRERALQLFNTSAKIICDSIKNNSESLDDILLVAQEGEVEELEDVENPGLEIFEIIPDFFISDTWTFLESLVFGRAETLDKVPLNNIISMMLLTLKYEKLLLSSPHTRGKVWQIVFRVFLPLGYQENVVNETDSSRQSPKFVSTATVRAQFMSHPLILERLIPTIMWSFSDVELMGHFEKVQFRRYILRTLRFACKNEQQMKRFNDICVHDSSKFEDFGQALISNLNFQLSGVMEALTTIHENESKLKNPEPMEMTVEERQSWDEEQTSLQSKVDEMRQQAQHQLASSTEILEWICFIVKNDSKPFTLPSIMPKMSAVLNTMIWKLCNPQRKELVISNPESIGFNPKWIILKFVEIAVVLGRNKEFAEGLASDGFYSEERYWEAVKVVNKITAGASIGSDLASLIPKLSELSKAAIDEEELFEDAPEEYMDPISCSLMVDPVRLPDSGIIVDRETILQHLSKNPHDPFSRASLTKSQLEDCTELRNEIVEWKKKIIADESNKK